MPNTATTVDERIVEMRIDSQKFETGAKKAIEILEKLDQKLDALDNTNTAGLDKMADSVESVGSKFSAFGDIATKVLSGIKEEIMGVVNWIETMTKSMTIDQIKPGWDKYAEKTASVQTIMAATAKDIGTVYTDQADQMEKVNEQLDKLNWFTDETSYNFVDMTNNIGKFTSNGIQLNKSVTAMQGIATWAAISGANAGEASRAMYNLSQALATGSVKLIDWKSIENANMATREFKEIALETAVSMGTLKKVGADTYETLAGHQFTTAQFNTQLADAWFSSDVLMKTLDQYGSFTDALHEVYEVTGLTTNEILEELDAYMAGDEVAAELIPHLEKLSRSEYELGRRAFKAAQEAKTFQEAIDSVKDAASTAWMNIFETMFGSYLDAKGFWTDVANTLYDVFVEPVNALYEIVDRAFGDESGSGINGSISSMSAFLEQAEISMEDFILSYAELDPYTVAELVGQYGSLDEAIRQGAVSSETLRRVLENLRDKAKGSVSGTAKSVDEQLEEMREVALAVIRGEHGVGEERRKAIEDMGYSYEMIQWLADQLYGTEWHDVEYLKNSMQQLHPEYLEQIAEAAGYSEEQIAYLNEAIEDSDALLDALMYGPSTAGMSGRELFTQSLLNILHMISGAVEAIGEAFSRVFGVGKDEKAVDVLGRKLYQFLEILYKVTSVLSMGFEAGGAEFLTGVLTVLLSTLKGIFGVIGSIFKIIGRVVGTAFVILMQFVNLIGESGILQSFGNAIKLIFDGLLVPFEIIGYYIGLLISSFKSLSEQTWAQNLLTILTGVAEKINKAAEGFNAFMRSGVVMDWISDKISDISTAFNYIWIQIRRFIRVVKYTYKKDGIIGVLNYVWSQIKRLTSGLLPSMQNFLSNIGNGVKNIFSSLITHFPWAERFINNAVFRLSILKKQISTAYQKNGILGVLDALRKDFTVFIRSHFPNAIKFIDNIKDKIHVVAQNAQEAFQTFLGNHPKISAFVTFIQNAFTTISTAISSAFSSIRNWLSGKSIGEIFDSIRTAIQTKIDELKKIYEENGIAGIFDAIFAPIRKKIDELKKLYEESGISGILSSIGELFSTIWSGFIEKFQNVTSFLSSPFDFLIKVLSAIGTGIADIYKEKGLFGIIKLIRGLSFIALLSNIRKLTKGFTGCLDSISESISAFSENKLGNKKESFTTAFLKIAGSILMIAVALALIAVIPEEQINRAFSMIGLLFIGITGVIVWLNKLDPLGTKAKSYGKVFLNIGLAILILAVVLWGLSKMEWDQYWNGLGKLFLVMLLLFGFIWAVNKFAGPVTGLKDLIWIALVLLVLVRVIKKLAKLTPGQLAQGLIGLFFVMAILVGSMIILERQVSTFKNAGFKQLIWIAVTAFIFVLLVKKLSKLTPGELATGLIGLFFIMLILVGSLAIIDRNVSSMKNKGLGKLILVALSVLIMVFALKKVIKAVKGASWKVLLTSIGIIVGIFALLIWLMKTVSKGNFSWQAVLVMLLAVGAIVAVGYELRKLSKFTNWKKLLVAAGSIALVMLAVIGALWALGKYGKKITWSAVAAFAVGIIAVVVIAEELGKLANLPWLNLLLAAVSIGLVLIAIAGALAIISNLKHAFTAIIGLAAGVIAFVIIARELGKLANQDWKSIAINAAICIVALIVLSGIVIALGAIGPGLVLKGVLTLAIVVFGISLIVWGLLALAGPILNTGIGTAEKLKDFMTSLQPFLDAVVGLTDDHKEGVTKLKEIMGSLAAAEFLGWLASIFDSLNEELGTRLSDFITNLQGFLDNVKLINQDHVTGAGYLVSIMGSVAGSDFISWLGSLFEGLKPGLGLRLSSFMITLQPFLAGLLNVTEAYVTGAGHLVSIMGSVAGSDFISWLGSLFEGLKPGLGLRLSSFMITLQPFLAGLLNITEAHATGAGYLNSIMQPIATSEFLGWIASLFDSLNPELGNNLSAFMINLKGFLDNITNVTLAHVASARLLKEVMRPIVASEFLGWISEAFDSLKLSFGLKLGSFMVSFMPFLNGLKDITEDHVTGAGYFGSVMSNLPEASLWGKLTELLNGLTVDMATDVSAFMTAFTPFLTGLASVPTDGKTRATALTDIVSTLVGTSIWSSIAGWVTDKSGSALSEFASELGEFVTAAQPFFEVMAGAKGEAFDNADRFAQVASALNGNGIIRNLGSDIHTFYDKIKDDDLTKMNDVLQQIGTFTEFIQTIAGGAWSNSFMSKGPIHDAFKAIISTDILELINNPDLTQIYNSLGTNMVAGIANGITSSTWLVENAMNYIARAAATAYARSKYNLIASPAKAYIKLASWIPKGIAEGIEENTDAPVESMTIMSSAVLAAMQMAMARVATIADDDFEFTPTITPVVDLSNVSLAAGSAGRMFGSVGLGLRGSMQINAENAENTAAAIEMNRGTNVVVSEIQRLSGKLEELGAAVSNMQIVLDTGVLVGATASRMDAALGIQNVRKSRWN